MPKLKNLNETFWEIFKQCEVSATCCQVLIVEHFALQDRDYALRSSVTAENLRSPSAAGTHGRDDDIDLNTDYAESDVMLGGGAPSSNSNNGSNNNSTEEGGGRNSNNNPRY